MTCVRVGVTRVTAFFSKIPDSSGGGDSVPVTDDLSTGYQVPHSSHLRRDEVWDFAHWGCKVPI